jgi:hypothetical protein
MAAKVNVKISAGSNDEFHTGRYDDIALDNYIIRDCTVRFNVPGA